KTINSTATQLILDLQEKTRAQINEGAFDVQSAIQVIGTKPLLPTSPVENKKLSLTDESPEFTPEYIIETYNNFILDMAGKTPPIDS
ncbi:hypothetical protein JHC42_11645, partial [Pseudomonas sp. OA3]|nr:hypothetical protein [Pseudomonas sp. OA3]